MTILILFRRVCLENGNAHLRPPASQSKSSVTTLKLLLM